MKIIAKGVVYCTLAMMPLAGASFLTSCAIKQKQETVGQYVDGSVITTTVKSKILADKTLRDTTITVKTFQNTVQLSGFVNNHAQRMRAAEIAMTTDGVRNVDNALVIKSTIGK